MISIGLPGVGIAAANRLRGDDICCMCNPTSQLQGPEWRAPPKAAPAKLDASSAPRPPPERMPLPEASAQSHGGRKARR